MNNDKPAPSALLHGMMEKAELEVAAPPPASIKVTFLKVVFDMQHPDYLKTIIQFRKDEVLNTVLDPATNPPGLFSMVEARYCTVEKKFTPMDVMQAIATGEIPPPWAWPHVEEGFV